MEIYFLQKQYTEQISVITDEEIRVYKGENRNGGENEQKPKKNTPRLVNQRTIFFYLRSVAPNVL